MPQLHLSRNKDVYCFPEGEKKKSKEKRVPETYLELCVLIHSELCVQAFVAKFLYYFQPLLSLLGFLRPDGSGVCGLCLSICPLL